MMIWHITGQTCTACGAGDHAWLDTTSTAGAVGVRVDTVAALSYDQAHLDLRSVSGH